MDLPGDATVVGDRAIFRVGGSAVAAVLMTRSELREWMDDDLRVLPVLFNAQGSRQRTFSDAANLLDETEPRGGFPIMGPRTCMWQVRAAASHGGSALAAHDRWVARTSLPAGDRSLHEHECLARILDAALTIDQINAPALLCMEFVVRRASLIREAHRLSPSSPDYSMADHWMGWGQSRGGGVAPDLTRYVAEQLRDEASVAKEARKAREEQKLRKNPKAKSSPKGGGRGRGGKGDPGEDG